MMNKAIHPAATSGAGRTAIYARYSSEQQREASIEDQIRICKARIAAEGWTLVATYRDSAQSGASHLRPGYQKLLADARSGSFNVVVAEALDRMSRPVWTPAGMTAGRHFASFASPQQFGRYCP